ncbi:hypothetical protein N3930_47200, partial [Bacillus thuringiensis]|nr:hypothetical protein [Bacillus thuringiensis]
SLGGAITNVLEESAVAEWGWRIPFLLGAVLALVALYMRRGMAESAVHEEQQEGTADTYPANATEQAPAGAETEALPTI